MRRPGFRDGLGATVIENRTVSFDYRWVEGSCERLPKHEAIECSARALSTNFRVVARRVDATAVCGGAEGHP